MIRINLLDQEAKGGVNIWFEEEEDDDKIIIHLDGTKQTTIHRKMDAGSHIAIFNKKDIRKIIKQDVTFTRPLPKNGQYVDYNQNQ